MRSLPRAAPRRARPLGVRRCPDRRDQRVWCPRLGRPLTAGLVGLSVLALPLLWRGQLVDANLDRLRGDPRLLDRGRGRSTPETTAAAARGARERLLRLVPLGQHRFTWCCRASWIARTWRESSIPYGSPASANLLNAFDHRLQETSSTPRPWRRWPGSSPPATSPCAPTSATSGSTPPVPAPCGSCCSTAPGILETLGFGPSERNTPRPELPCSTQIGPPHASLPAGSARGGGAGIEDPEKKIVRTAPTDRPVVLCGDGATASSMPPPLAC